MAELSELPDAEPPQTTETVLVGRRWVIPNRELIGGDADRDEVIVAGPTTEPPPDPIGWVPAQVWVEVTYFTDADARYSEENTSP